MATIYGFQQSKMLTSMRKYYQGRGLNARIKAKMPIWKAIDGEWLPKARA